MADADVSPMKTTSLLKFGFVALLVLFAGSARASDTKPPNIVYILADDLGYGDVRCLNPQGKIATPHLDRLAAAGMIFTDAHSSSAVCTPTRYGLLTGRYNWRSRLKSGVMGGMSPPLIEPGRLTVPAFLQQQGYHTACIGKWHLGFDWPRQLDTAPFTDGIEKGADGWRVDFSKPIARGPNALGFDYFFGLAASLDMVPYSFIENDRVTKVPTMDKAFPMMFGRTNGATRKGPAAADFEAIDVLPTLTRRAVAYINERASAAKSGRPFFLYIPLNAPHTPIAPSKEWQGKSGLNPYADFVMETDARVGEVLDALDRNGVADNTLVIFTSDNGCSPEAKFPELLAKGHNPSAQFRGTKADIFEGGHRVPFLVRWPGRVKPGTTSDQLICLNDLFATCADLLGAKLPDNAAEDSVSLLPALEGRATGPIREALVHHSINGSFALRQGNWKLELCADSGGWSAPRPGSPAAKSLPAPQLYDLAADLAETNNVARAHPEVVARLTQLLGKYAADGRSTPGAAQANTTPVEIRQPADGAVVKAAQPNIVIFLADDSGWGDYSVSGNTQVRTPNIDSIARAGASLDRFYVCAVCAPTRAEFLTGRYHSRTGVRGVSTGQERMNTDEKTLADAFKAAGYATGAFGKWHNGSQWPYHPNARGFDEYYGFTSGHWGEYFNPPLEHHGQPVRGRGFIADDLTSRAIEFIEKNREKPFLCYVPFNTPHSPWAVPDEYWQRFKDKPLTLRGTDSKQESLDQTRCALAMMENLDDNVGRVLKRLDELKLADNTIVIYFSDNGPNGHRWTGGMKGTKGTTDEGGVRSVFFLRWTGGGIKAGTVVKEITGAIDLLPTLTALAGVKRVGNKSLDGRNLSPLLRGEPMAWRERLIFSHQNGNVSARSQQYRLDQRGALFDMIADPSQTKDITSDQPDIAAQMTKAVADWRGEVLPKSKDDRPYPVGYAEFPRTPLPARDGVPHGGVKRSANAPNSSYFVNWTSLDDTMTWDVEVNTAGNYDVEILYTCPVADAGSTIELDFNGAKLAGEVAPGWDPPLYTNQDTIARPNGESKMKEFRALNLGSMRLEKGRGLLTLRALKIPGRSVMDVRQVNLALRK